MTRVIDATALILMLSDASGAAEVVAALPGARVSVLSLTEVALHFRQLGMPVEEIEAMLRPLPIQRVAVDQGLAWGAVELGVVELGPELSLGALVAVAMAAEAALAFMSADLDAIALARRLAIEVVVVGLDEARGEPAVAEVAETRLTLDP